MQFKIIAIPATGDHEAEEDLNRFLRGHRVVSVLFPGQVRLARRSRDRFWQKLRLCHENYTCGVWDEETTARHVEPLLAFVRRAESSEYRRRVLERVGLCPKVARTA